MSRDKSGPARICETNATGGTGETTSATTVAGASPLDEQSAPVEVAA